MSEMNASAAPWLLVMNCGSSSIKYQLIDLSSQRWQLKGLLENIGAHARHRITRRLTAHEETEAVDVACPDALAALTVIASTLQSCQARIAAVVHRVVHGGDAFTKPLRITPETLQALAPLDALAPLHNPANVLGIRMCAELFPQLAQYAVFDTAYHATLPAHAYRYAVPDAWHAAGVRRYGFHGTSHRHIARKTAAWLNKPLHATSLISLHLGNGASITAIANGQSVDTSMGFTPLQGLIMGTRCGDLDVGIPGYIARQQHLSLADIEHQLWHESGLRGIAGTNDMRKLLTSAAAGDASAQLAMDMYCYRGKQYIGAYLAVLPQVDAIVFTGGVGENAAPIRAKMLEGLSRLGIALDPASNTGEMADVSCISSDTGSLPILVIRTNEELEMAIEVAPLLGLQE